MIDLVLAVIVGLITWMVATEGAWGAAVAFLSVVLAGLLSMNFFEPLATALESLLGVDWSLRVDIIALVVPFAAIVFGLRYLSEWLVPNFIAVHPRLYDAARWVFGFGTGYVTMAFLLTALHTAPLPREFFGFTPERKNLFGVVAPDREWLGFVQYVSEKPLRSSDDAVFDGTRFRLPGHDNEIWPTFIIRYASRRDEGSSISIAPPGGTEMKARQPAPVTSKSGGGPPAGM